MTAVVVEPLAASFRAKRALSVFSWKGVSGLARADTPLLAAPTAGEYRFGSVPLAAMPFDNRRAVRPDLHLDSLDGFEVLELPRQQIAQA